MCRHTLSQSTHQRDVISHSHAVSTATAAKGYPGGRYHNVPSGPLMRTLRRVATCTQGPSWATSPKSPSHHPACLLERCGGWVPTLCTVKNPCVPYGQPCTPTVLHRQIQPAAGLLLALFTTENNLRVSGPTKFKPVLLMVQLYFLSKTYPYQQLPGNPIC